MRREWVGGSMLKPIEYWAALVGMVIYVATRDAEQEPLSRRLLKTAASALLTIGLSPDVSARLGVSEIVAAVGVMAFGMLALDVATALIRDRDFIKDLIQRRWGGPK